MNEFDYDVLARDSLEKTTGMFKALGVENYPTCANELSLKCEALAAVALLPGLLSNICVELHMINQRMAEAEEEKAKQAEETEKF